MLFLPFSRFLKPTTLNPYVIRICFSTLASSIKNAPSSHEALKIYSSMHRNSVPIDSFSILFTLKSCALLHNLSVIHHLHSHIIKLGYISHVYVATCLLRSYEVTSFVNACLLFDEMPEKNTVTWNTMIAGYARLGNMNKARTVFDEMLEKNVVSWNAMIMAYVNHGYWNKGLLLYREMMTSEEIKPDQVTVVTVLSCCVNMGSVGLLTGKSLHGFAVKNGWEVNVRVGTILVDMYAKCGFFENALQVFRSMQERNVMTWTALICGAAKNGLSLEALSFFKMMQESNSTPNEMTFTGILNACAHSGLVEEGREFFRMIEEYDLEVKLQHYGCMVDLFGKAGLLEEAYEVIKTMRFQANVVIWGSFLSACMKHKQFDMAERVIEQVLKIIKPENDGGIYTLICDIYALNEKWDDAERVRKLMLNQNVRKARGLSAISKGV